MTLFGRRCGFCGLYIKRWQRAKHEAWHADQAVHILKLLCGHCATEHGKDHVVCGKYPSCRCVCNMFGED